MIMKLPWIMARCLILTVLFECGTAFVIGAKNKKDLLNILLVNVLTNPLVVISVVIVNMYFGSRTAVIYEYIAEVAVVLVEGLIYRKTLNFKKLNPFLLSLILNGVSYLTGEILNKIFY